eukprot:47123-Eustigmatos_ZCMA.PRE.1
MAMVAQGRFGSGSLRSPCTILHSRSTCRPGQCSARHTCEARLTPHDTAISALKEVHIRRRFDDT